MLPTNIFLKILQEKLNIQIFPQYLFIISHVICLTAAQLVDRGSSGNWLEYEGDMTQL